MTFDAIEAYVLRVTCLIVLLRDGVFTVNLRGPPLYGTITYK